MASNQEMPTKEERQQFLDDVRSLAIAKLNMAGQSGYSETEIHTAMLIASQLSGGPLDAEAREAAGKVAASACEGIGRVEMTITPGAPTVDKEQLS